MKNYEVQENVDLTLFNTYNIKSSAKYLIYPKCILELVDIIKYLKNEQISYYVLGGGSNVILPDKKFNGAIIKLNHLNTLIIKNNYAYVGAGHNLSLFIQKLMSKDFCNLSSLYGIPGTIGGAIYGNAGVKDIDIFTFLKSILVYKDGDILLKKASNIKHSYRDTEFKNSDYIILGATFKLQKGDGKKALNDAKQNLKNRALKQPITKKTAGSVFKNPLDQPAWQIIKERNRDKLRVNDAIISPLHCNFIENLKNAKSRDIIELINIVKKDVYKKKKINLELEQIIVKW